MRRRRDAKDYLGVSAPLLLESIYSINEREIIREYIVRFSDNTFSVSCCEFLSRNT